jgi:hypothetical protein
MTTQPNDRYGKYGDFSFSFNTRDERNKELIKKIRSQENFEYFSDKMISNICEYVTKLIFDNITPDHMFDNILFSRIMAGVCFKILDLMTRGLEKNESIMYNAQFLRSFQTAYILTHTTYYTLDHGDTKDFDKYFNELMRSYLKHLLK